MPAVDEFALIEKILKPCAGRRTDVLLGIGDDGAVVQPPVGEALVVVVDTLVEGVHFPPSLLPADLGYRALAVNLSDIAAMGATPRWATLALTMPVAREEWLRAFAEGLQAGLAAHDVALIGGDTTRGPLTITIQLIGSVPPGLALLRRGAREGDAIYVSGTLGDAAAGLACMQREEARNAAADFLVARFARPTPRVALGRALRGIATSCIDISDGLIADLGHLARLSGCGALLEASLLPLSDALCAAVPRTDALAYALSGGDDYELCFSIPLNRAQMLERTLGAHHPLRQVGVFTATRGEVAVIDENGHALALARAGFRHFE